MAELKSYTCSKCGGVLNFDSDQEIFDCPFCGNRFETIDFHEDELLSQAEESLKQKAFPNAREKYIAILKKYPKNFEALRGKLLCEIGISSLDDIKTPEDFDKCNLEQAQKAVKSAMPDADPKTMEYLRTFVDLIRTCQAYKLCARDHKMLASPATQDYLRNKYAEEREKALGEAKDANPAYYVFGFIIAAFMIILGISSGEGAGIPIIFGVSLIILLLISAGLVNLKKEQADAIPKSGEPARDKMKNRVDNYLNDYRRKHTTLQKFEDEAREEYLKKTAPEKDIPEGPKVDYSIEKLNPLEKIACAKCGAMLNLDTEKRVYRCDSCGVAYGVSLFFGLPWEKSLNAMNSGRFEEAMQRFSNALLVNPSDFEAYLGIILCEGKWTKVSDIDESGWVDVDASRRIFALIRKAKTQISEADQVYLDELWKMISALKKLGASNKKLKALKDDLKKSESKAKLLHQYDTYYDDSLTALVNNLRAPTNPHEMIDKKLKSEIEECKKEIEQLRPEFNAIRESVLAKRTDSVFCK